MKIDLLVISHRIKYKVLNIFINDPERKNLVSARLFSAKSKSTDDDAVYIGKTGEITADQDARLPTNLICIGHGNISALTSAKTCNILQIDGSGIVDVINDVQGIFDFYNSIDKELMNEVLKESTLQTILDVCSRFFDNPIFVVDSAKKLIAQSSNLKDPEWVNVEKTGYATVEIINRMLSLDMLSDKSRKPQINMEEKIPPSMTANMFINNEKIGSVGVKRLFTDISTAQFALLEHVTEVLTVVLSKEKYSHHIRTGSPYRFIIDLIKGTSRDIDMIKYHLSKLGWKLNDEYFLLKIIPHPKDEQGGTLKYTGEIVMNLFKGSVMLIMSDVIVVVINVCKCSDDMNLALAALREFIEKHHCLCGMSPNFIDFSTVSEQYSLASSALEVGKLIDENEHLFNYRQYLIPHIISICDQKLNIRMLCHSAAIKLYEYDMNHDSNYLYCLYNYLKNERSLVLTSKILNIHRSTLIYKLNKISEIIKIDINDADVRFHMILSYEILHFLDSRLQ